MVEMKTRILIAVGSTAQGRPRPGRQRACYGNQRGSVAVISAFAIVGMVAFCGLALDLSMVYNRQAELRNLGDSAALAAARKLNGTSTGVADAVAAAAAMAATQQYKYGSATVTWSPSAVTFSTSPDRSGTWVDAGAAAASPALMMYVRVDTAEFTGSGEVQTLFMPVVSTAMATVTTQSASIAGRTSIDAMPLAICAMDVAAKPRAHSGLPDELIEYGFRRGVSYDLMNLNPNGSTPANFVINPLAPPGQPGSSTDVLPAKVGPYVCNGSLDIPRLSGDTISVAPGFPLASLQEQLNSRFDQYPNGLCNFRGAPPDANIQSYVEPSGSSWMGTPPDAQVSPPAPTAPPLQTYADLPQAINVPPGRIGPVWAYAKAVRFSSYVPGAAEPATGYTPFLTPNWLTLYRGQSAKPTYPAINTPYRAAIGANFLAPSLLHRPGIRGRRVLNVPLLSCATMPTTSATVLAVGKFFMTVPAGSTVLAAEFAGAVPLQNVQSHVELFQ